MNTRGIPHWGMQGTLKVDAIQPLILVMVQLFIPLCPHPWFRSSCMTNRPRVLGYSVTHLSVSCNHQYWPTLTHKAGQIHTMPRSPLPLPTPPTFISFPPSRHSPCSLQTTSCRWESSRDSWWKAWQCWGRKYLRTPFSSPSQACLNSWMKERRKKVYVCFIKKRYSYAAIV